MTKKTNPFQSSSASDVPPMDNQMQTHHQDDDNDGDDDMSMRSAMEEHDDDTDNNLLLGGAASGLGASSSLPGVGSALSSARRRRQRPGGGQRPPAVSFRLLDDDVENNSNINPGVTNGGDPRSPLLADDGANDNNNEYDNGDDIPADDPHRRYSLATDPSTPRFLAFLLSLLLLATHGLFLYGQIVPMWRLRVRADVDVWANATTFASRKTFDAIGLNQTTHIDVNYHDDVATFTYGYAIRQLWIAAGLPNKFMSRLAAVLLVIFSGLWPHLKLLLLHRTFWKSHPVHRYKSRTATLYWLSTFGKYTLADVFVVCALIGIVALDWTVDPAVVRDGLSAELPTLVLVAKSMYTSTEACTRMLGYDCGSPPSFLQKTKCWTCETAVDEAYSHPDWARGAGRKILKGVATDGGGLVDLRVAGMRGIYPFCAAAILSLLLGVVVDLLDHRSRRRVAHSSAAARANRARDQNFGLVAAEEDYALDDHAYAALLPSASRNDPTPRRCSSLLHRVLPPGGPDTWGQSLTAWFGYLVLIGASLLAAFLVYWGCTVPTMERKVIGAIPEVAQNVMGISWERPYSLQSLVQVSGAEGGLDYMLMGTFALFVLVGPIVRSILCVANLILPWTKGCHELLLTAINIVGAFSAWEVFAIATYMVDDLIPTVTNTIIQQQICNQLSPETNSCLMIEFNILDAFVGLLVVGGTLLVLLSMVVVRYGFAGTDPYEDGDAGGPYFDCCCSCKRNNDDDDADDGIEKTRPDGNNASEDLILDIEYFPMDDEDLASETGILL